MQHSSSALHKPAAYSAHKNQHFTASVSLGLILVLCENWLCSFRSLLSPQTLILKANEHHGRLAVQCAAHQPADYIRTKHFPDMGTFEALAIFFLSGCQSQSVAQNKPKYSAKSHLTSCC